MLLFELYCNCVSVLSFLEFLKNISDDFTSSVSVWIVSLDAGNSN